MARMPNRSAALVRNTTPADRLFLKLMHDIKVANEIAQGIKTGAIDKMHQDKVDKLERKAWKHLYSYLAGKEIA